MGNSPVTQPSLLVRLQSGEDQEAWSRFVDLYGPLVYSYARKWGLQDADAADVVQDVLRRCATAIKRLDYDRQRGTFRGWLLTVVRNHLRSFLETKAHSAQGTGDSAAQQLLADQPAPEESDAFEREYQQQVFRQAAEQVRGDFEESTWQAFWQTAVEGRAGKDVAAELGISVAAVYLAKARVMARLKEQIRLLELQ